MKNLIVTLLGIGATLLLGGCQDDPEPTVALFDTRWSLEQVDDTPVTVSSNSAEYTSFIKFKGTDNTTIGSAACNTILGTFSLKAGTQQLTISRQGTSYAYCGKTPLTDRYLDALPLTTRYEIDGRTLRLYDASLGKPRLIFQAMQ